MCYGTCKYEDSMGECRRGGLNLPEDAFCREQGDIMRYKCLKCGEIHDFKLDALQCCGHCKQVYQCVVCKEPHHTDWEADECCQDKKIEEIDDGFEEEIVEDDDFDVEEEII